jgi:cytoskeleton protein RodZ
MCGNGGAGMDRALQHDLPIVQFGEFLKAARERRGVSLPHVSNTTKIPLRHLEALERGDLSVIPEGPYRRGEVRAFAQAVGMDPGVAIARLEEALKACEPPPEEPPPAPAPTVATVAWPLIPAALVAAMVAVLAVTIWSREASVARSSESIRTPVHEDAVPASVPRASPAAGRSVPPPPADIAVAAVPSGMATPRPAGDTAAEIPATLDASESASSPQLVVSSDPPGSRVVVDGIARGTTPLTIQYLPMGAKRVRVVRDGYVSEERTVRLTATRPATELHVDLRPAQ